jgi:hypothetical protein
VELRGAQDARGDRARERRLLLGELGRVVAVLELLDADDRHEHAPLHAGLDARLLQVARGGREELRRLLLVRRGAGRRVDDGVHAIERLGEALTRDHVDTLRAGDRDDVVALGLEDVDQVMAEPPRRSRYGNLRTHRWILLSHP